MARRRTKRPKPRSSKGRARRPRRRRVSWFKTAVLLGILALVGYGAWVVRGYLASTLEIKHIEVSGNRSLASADVMELSGLCRGASLLWTSLGSAKERLESDLRIRSARLHREFPDKVRIEITEREPFAILKSPAGWHLADSEGVIFRRIESTNRYRTAGLATIVLNSNSKEGEWATLAVGCIQKAAGVFPDKVAEVEVSSNGAFILRLDCGLLVRLGAGSESDLAGKIELAAEILQRDAQLCTRAEYLDVSSTGAPACRMKGDGDPEPGTDD